MIDIAEPTELIPGSEAKVELLCARYDHGIPLWVRGDRNLQCSGDEPWEWSKSDE